MKLIKLKKSGLFYYIRENAQNKRDFGHNYKKFKVLLQRKTKLRALKIQLLSGFFFGSKKLIAVSRILNLLSRINAKLYDSTRKMA